jgi:putative inorganic carbon (HCO3(-)) transporter
VKKLANSGLFAALLLMAAAMPFSIAAAQSALGLAVLFWLLKLITDYNSELLKTPISKVFLIWVAVGFLAAVFAYRPDISLPAMKEEWLFLGFFVAWGGVANIRQWRTIVLVLAFAATIGSLYAVWQHFTGEELVHHWALSDMISGYRAQGTLTNYLTFGGMFTLLGLFLAPLVGREEGWRRYFLTAASVLTLLAAALSYSRSAILAIVVGLGVLVLLLYRSRGWRMLILPALLLVVILAVQPDVLYRFARENPRSSERRTLFDQGQKRLDIWYTGLKMYLAHPILGVGQDNFLQLYENFAPPGDTERYAGAHNDLLMSAATKGTLGLIAYILIWVALVRQLWRKYRTSVTPIIKVVAVTGLVVAAGYLVMSQFEAFFSDEEVRLALLFLLGMVFVRMKLRA